MEPSVTQDWLVQRLTDPVVRVVDCRYVLGRPGAGRERYREGHIAGAAFMDLDDDLAGPVGDRRRGRHPLPAPDAFSAAARRAGIGADSVVVAYDEDRSGGAARLWWLLRHFGHDAVTVLAGGFDAWTGPVAGGEEHIAPGDFVAAQGGADDVADARDVAARLRRPGRILIDARAPERFRGDVEPVDPVPGRIPGAVNVPFTSPVPDDLVTTDDEVVVYCGSGVTACVVVHELAVRGRHDARLYPGSYSEWSTRGLPTERG